MRALSGLCLVLVLTVGCQPAGGPGAATPTPQADPSGRPLGAPNAGAASTVPELLELGATVAEEWQEEPVLAEVHVELDAAGAWTTARLVYVAAEADRILQLETAGSGFTDQRPSLATLNLQPVPADALSDVPPFPEDATPPQDLARSEAAAACGVAGDATVLYATGAPYAWDGTAWSREPAWQATGTGADGGGVTLEPAGEGGDCLES